MNLYSTNARITLTVPDVSYTPKHLETRSSDITSFVLDLEEFAHDLYITNDRRKHLAKPVTRYEEVRPFWLIPPAGPSEPSL
jgi:hypothetical protein